MEISTGKVIILLDLGLKKSTRLTIDQLKKSEGYSKETNVPI